MAGEVEDDFTFQADSLPNGSITFGRFEAESLSWERKSSFSHNRYLEEVEKYSTPGSVTKKKAYFEAHFKKKPLQSPASSESQNGVEFRSTANVNEDHIRYVEGCAYLHNSGEQQFDWPDETPAVSCEHQNHALESSGRHVQFSWYDEGPLVSDQHDHDEIKETGAQLKFDWYDETPGSDGHEHNGYEHEQEETSTWDYQIEANPLSEHKVLDFSSEPEVKSLDLQFQPGDDCIPLRKEETCEVAEQKADNGSVNSHVVVEQKSGDGANAEAVGVLNGISDILLNSAAEEKANAVNLKKAQHTSLKVKATKQKTVEKPKAMMPPAEAPRNKLNGTCSVSSLQSIKTSRKLERDNIVGRKPEKQSPLRPLSTLIGKSSFRAENSESLKVTGAEERKSDKGQPAKKVGLFQPISGKQDVRGHQSGNRKQSTAGFSFKVHERAEKRKEFLMKLEEKVHAREVQMNEIQAKTQEKTEAEIEKFRRSLNFKATPMPSFYHEVAPRVFDRKKMTVPQGKHLPVRNKCTTLGSRTAPPENWQASMDVTKRGLSSEPPSSALADCLAVLSEDDAGQESRSAKKAEKKERRERQASCKKDKERATKQERLRGPVLLM